MKPKDPVWGFFSSWEEGKTSVICKGCNSEVSAKALRLKVHREKCPGLIKLAEERKLREGNEPPVEERFGGDQHVPQFGAFQQGGVGGYNVTSGANRNWMWEQMVRNLSNYMYSKPEIGSDKRGVGLSGEFFLISPQKHVVGTH